MFVEILIQTYVRQNCAVYERPFTKCRAYSEHLFVKTATPPLYCDGVNICSLVEPNITNVMLDIPNKKLPKHLFVLLGKHMFIFLI